jgi:translation initiation factor 2 subunit 2
MEYEQLLDSAFKKVNKTENCDRFEVKKINTIHEGHNKTIITNFMQLAMSLRRNQEHLAKFLYKNLASYGEIAGERLILGRKISSDIINKKIDLYINEYVCCPKCKKPDTEIIEEEGKAYLRCLACGIKKEVHK